MQTTKWNVWANFRYLFVSLPQTLQLRNDLDTPYWRLEACSRQRTAEAEPGGYRGGGLNSLVNADEVYTCIYSNRLQDSFKTRHPQLSTGCMFGCSFLCQVVSTQRIWSTCILYKYMIFTKVADDETWPQVYKRCNCAMKRTDMHLVGNSGQDVFFCILLMFPCIHVAPRRSSKLRSVARADLGLTWAKLGPNLDHLAPTWAKDMAAQLGLVWGQLRPKFSPTRTHREHGTVPTSIEAARGGTQQ